jgi:phage terminase small subunit
MQKQLGKSKTLLEMRARKIALAVLSGKTETQAALEAGYSPSTAKNVGEILENPVVKRVYNETLDKAGATDEACAKVIVDALDAMKTVSCVSGKDAGSSRLTLSQSKIIPPDSKPWT